ncbi:MAG: sigma-70 family RNA polymerase sigma factor [Planctomycetota bacterium]
MAALQGGDEEAFTLLVGRHRSAVVNLCFRYLGNRADAEDLAQEVFLRVYRARDRYRPEAKFTTWLYRIAVNTSLNELRNRKNRPTQGAATLQGAGAEESAGVSVADPSLDEPLAVVEQDELHDQVRAAVEELPERQRMAILLNKFHGLSYEELAETMEMTIPGVKSLLVRARENVRRHIEPYLHRGAERKGTA